MNEEHSEDRARMRREFRRRQTRQIVAIAAALLLVLLLATVHKRPDLFGSYARSTLFGLQVIIIAAFLGYTAVNWRCPSCRSFLGSDIHRSVCRKCGAHLQ